MSRYTTGNGETLMTSKKALAALILISFGSVAALPAAADPGLPSYAAPAPQGAQGESIHGTIAAVIDKYHLTLNDDRGFVDHVTLRASTTINPPGLTLQNGEPVMINGHADGHEFVAEEIDAPNPDAQAQQSGSQQAKQPDERIIRCGEKMSRHAALLVAEARIPRRDDGAVAVLIDRERHLGGMVVGVTVVPPRACNIMIRASAEGRQQKSACQMAQNFASGPNGRCSGPGDVAFFCHGPGPLKRWPNT